MHVKRLDSRGGTPPFAWAWTFARQWPGDRDCFITGLVQWRRLLRAPPALGSSPGAGITSFMLGGSEAVRVDQFRSPPNSREEAEDDGPGGGDRMMSGRQDTAVQLAQIRGVFPDGAASSFGRRREVHRRWDSAQKDLDYAACRRWRRGIRRRVLPGWCEATETRVGTWTRFEQDEEKCHSKHTTRL